MLKHVVFDFDGTLANSEEVCIQLLNEMAAKHGYRQVSRVELLELKRLSYPDRLQYLGVPVYRIPFLSVDARRRYRELQDGLTPFEDVPETLVRLRESGFRLHVLSSNAVPNIRAFLERHDVNLFDTVTCERSFFGKHIGLRRFMRAHGLARDEVVYVADEVRDVEACRKIDLSIISAGWGFDLLENLREANPDLTALTPTDAVQMIQTLEPARARALPVRLLDPQAVAMAQ